MFKNYPQDATNLFQHLVSGLSRSLCSSAMTEKLKQYLHNSIRPNFVGFTIAEILITLGIIGVVAALTMPIIISNYKKHEVEVRLQRAYTTLAQAIKLASVDYGETSQWDYSNSETVIKKYFLPYLSGAEFLNASDLRKIKVHFPDIDIDLSVGYSKGIMLKTGEIISIYDNTNTPNSDTEIQSFYILLKQNKNNSYVPGKDVFTAYLRKKSGALILYSHPAQVLYSDDYLASSCPKYGWTWACGYLIMKNSWKISDNYPIKF